MSLFRSILEKLGLGSHAAPSAEAAPAPQNTGTAPTAGNASAPQTSGAAPAGVSQVDVAQHLDSLPGAQQLNWRTSIVDLLKLLDLDSSLTARKDLANELHYSGSTDDSAAMNTWLHAQVLKKLAENGGKVPADLLD